MSRESKFLLSAAERTMISALLNSPWVGICVPSGVVSTRPWLDPHVYSVGYLIVESSVQVAILLDAIDVAGGNEVFKLSAIAEQERLQHLLANTRPPMKKLRDIPTDLG